MEDRKPIFSVRKQDLRIDTFSAGGPGGQNQNKRESGVRMVHLATGISAESRVHREQKQNKREAFRKLAQRLVAWFRRTLHEGMTARFRPNEVVRTYHAPDNRVVDKAHGERVSYGAMLNDPAATELMVDARREAMFLAQVREQDRILNELHGSDDGDED